MGDRASAGFTILESILFLAVTGALIGGLMLATSSTLSVQRYRDATESFKALLQEQYADLGSVQNSRDNALACDSEAAVDVGDELRGQSECVLVGKYMAIRGGDVQIYPVLAWEINSTTTSDDDIDALRNSYRLNLAQAGVEDKKLEWDTRISWATTGTAADADDRNISGGVREIDLLFLRSPVSGQVYTFSSNTVPTTAQIDGASTAPAFIREMIEPGAVVPGQKGRTICLDSAGLTAIPNTSVYIAPYASGASAVEVRSNDVASSQGLAVRC